MADFRQPAKMGRLTVDIPEELLATVLDVLLRAWEDAIARKIVLPTAKEDEITDRLYDGMYDEKTRRELDNIDFEREPQSNLAHDPRPLGFIDVKVSFNSWRRTDYFAIECKRVSATQVTPAKSYVDEGVVRFVSEKYSPGHRWGAMVGYVVNGDVGQCAQLLGSTLGSHNTTATRIKRHWAQELRFSEYAHCYSSEHEQEVCRKVITLLHVLLGFSPNQN